MSRWLAARQIGGMFCLGGWSLSDLYDQRAQPCDDQPGDFPACDRLAEEQHGKDGNPDQHGTVDDAGFHGGERAQGVVPERESKRSIDQRQPEQYAPMLPCQDRQSLHGDPCGKQHDRASAHAEDRHDQRVVPLRAINDPAKNG